jgi:carbon monoxide dehydrogenase subunit G
VEIENTFAVASDPDRVYAYLLDINRVVACVPGAQLSEVVDPTTFRGKVKIKVGPVTVSYDGVARIVSRDDDARVATLAAEGRETTGPGSAKAVTTMSVRPHQDGSAVNLATDFTVVGRVAQFGRGIMEDVSKRLIEQMATCIRERLEENADAGDDDPAVEVTGAPAPEASTEMPATASAPAPAEPVAIDALALARGVAGDRLRRVDRRAKIAAAVALILAVLFILRRRR